MSRFYVSRKNPKGCWIMDELDGVEEFYTYADVRQYILPKFEVEGILSTEHHMLVGNPWTHINSKLKLLSGISAEIDNRGFLRYFGDSDNEVVVLSKYFKGIMEGAFGSDRGYSVKLNVNGGVSGNGVYHYTLVFDKPLVLEGDIFWNIRMDSTNIKALDFSLVKDMDYLLKLYQLALQPIRVGESQYKTFDVKDDVHRLACFNTFLNIRDLTKRKGNRAASDLVLSGQYKEPWLKTVRKLFIDFPADCLMDESQIDQFSLGMMSVERDGSDSHTLASMNILVLWRIISLTIKSEYRDMFLAAVLFKDAYADCKYYDVSYHQDRVDIDFIKKVNFVCSQIVRHLVV